MRDLDILESWKEIADYLKKAERTCRRWEKEFGLPIHRLDGSPKARVFAYKHELDKWIQEMLHTADDAEKKSPSLALTLFFKKALFPLMGVITIGVIVVLIWRPWPAEQAAPIPTDIPSLAVVYFENLSQDESLDGWRTGLTELLITDLMQSKYVRVLSHDRVYGILKELDLLQKKRYTTDDLIKVANEGLVNHTVSGSFIRAGDSIVITLLLQKPHSGEVIESIKVTCEGEEGIVPKVDELTKQIKLDLNLSSEQMFADIDKAIGEITTNSPEAYKYYGEGMRQNLQREYRLSIPFFKKAISIDPEFASAYRKLADAYKELDYREKRRECLKRAFELTDRIPERERLQIQGDYYRESWRTYDKSLESYNKLLELYPDDVDGNENSAILYFNIEEWDKALERWLINVNNKNYIVTASYSNAATTYQALGMFEKAREILNSFVINIQDHPTIRWRLANNYLADGKYDLALLEANKSLSLRPTYYRGLEVKGCIHLCLQDIESANLEFQKLLGIEEESAHIDAREHLGFLYLVQGKFDDAWSQTRMGIELAQELEMKWRESYLRYSLVYARFASGQFNKALEECHEALSIARDIDRFLTQTILLHLKGLILVDMKSLPEAERAAEELNDFIEQGMHKKWKRYYFDLMGRIELERKRFPESIEFFTKAISVLPGQRKPNLDNQALFFQPLALAYYESRDYEQAKEWYQRILSLSTGRIRFGDIYARSIYMLGKICQEQGNTAKAIEYYEKFLDLWKDADPRIAEVEYTRKRLAGLKSQ